MISPARFNEMVSVVQRPSKSRSAKLWEICSGTGVLSAAARKRSILRTPPIDHRYGWRTARSRDQIMILHGLLNIGVLCLFAAPNCALWGSMTRGLPASVLEARRAREFPGLRFLALCCLVQVLLNRHFIVENSWASQIFSCSPLHILDPIGLITTKVDQCMYGAELDGTGNSEEQHVCVRRSLGRTCGALRSLAQPFAASRLWSSGFPRGFSSAIPA